jgi:hypothetical protein
VNVVGKRWFRRNRASEALNPTTDAEWEVISEQVKQNDDERKRAVAGQESLVAEVSKILFEADFVGINFEDNTDEYDPEAETIVHRTFSASLTRSSRGGLTPYRREGSNSTPRLPR